jgi:hypothetical protein
MKSGDKSKIAAFFGSREAWENIPGWDGFALAQPSQNPCRLNHGYDESIPDEDLGLHDVRDAAQYRGGDCLSPDMERGDLTTKLRWYCAYGHTFEASPRLVLKAGHWCPECAHSTAPQSELAKRNPFLAQVVQ